MSELASRGTHGIDICPECNQRGTLVIESTPHAYGRRRRRRCAKCRHRWSTVEVPITVGAGMFALRNPLGDLIRRCQNVITTAAKVRDSIPDVEGED